MKKTVIVIAVLMLLIAGRAHAYKDGDFQIWHTEAQDISLKDNTRIALDEEWRYGDNASELYYQHYEVGLFYDANKYLSTSINYRQVYEGEKGKFKPEFRPFINIIPKCEVYGCAIEDRNRFELRLYDNYREDTVRYRNRLLIRGPWKITPLGIRPYVSNEIFVDLDNTTFRRNRFTAGVTFNVMKGIQGDIYYMLQSTKRAGHWTDANILGLKAKVAF